jgi:glycosyltransferase involved in cell wall biosynthesis
VHVHYDEFWNILHELHGGKICVSSHYPYIERPEKWPRDGYGIVFNGICEAVKNHGVHLYCISVKDKNAYLKMGSLPESKVFLMQNGVNTDSFPFVQMPEFFRRSIVVAKIEPRKRQYLTYLLPQVDYVGRGPCNHSNYRGEIEPRENLVNLLTKYGNFVLLSDGENGSPLVVKEAMAAGLGVVLSESAANELPKLPWVTVIPDADLTDSLKLNRAIELNRANSLPLRNEIREWVRREWDWSKLVDLYIKNIKS